VRAAAEVHDRDAQGLEEHAPCLPRLLGRENKEVTYERQDEDAGTQTVGSGATAPS
jgi:hypothetical protein